MDDILRGLEKFINKYYFDVNYQISFLLLFVAYGNNSLLGVILALVYQFMAVIGIYLKTQGR